MVEIQTCPSPIFMSQMSSREIAEYVSSENPAFQGSSAYIMAIRFVEFSSKGYKIGKNVVKSISSKKIIELLKLD